MADDVLADLGDAVTCLRTKTQDHHLLWLYYAGDAPRKWLTRKLSEIFEDLSEDIGEDNWVEMAVNEPIQRLAIQSWSSEQPPAADSFGKAWEASSMRLDEDDLYRSIGVVNEGFVFATKKTVSGPADLTLVSASEVYWPERVKRDPRVVARVWRDTEDGRWRATLWYRTTVVRLVGPSWRDTHEKAIPNPNLFELLDDPQPHGFARVPVVRFTGPKAKSLVATVVPNQDRINKLTANKMVAAEFAAFPQRVFLTKQRLRSEDVTASPHHAIVLDPGGGDEGYAPTSVEELTAAQLSNYDDSIQQEIFKLFSRASLPKHLFGDAASGMSAKAIRADEAPLVNLVTAIQEETDPGFEDLAELLGYEGVRPVWRPAETPDDETIMTTVKTAVDARVPLDVALKYLAGWSEDRLAELEKPETLAQTLDNLTKLGLAAQAGGVDPAVAREVGMRTLTGPAAGPAAE